MRRYEQVIRVIEERIRGGSLRPGERLPSVRALSEAFGFSVVTVYHAYGELEAAGLIIGHPRAGFRVAPNVLAVAAASSKRQSSAAETTARDISLEDLSFRILSDWHPGQPSPFGAVYPSADLFPLADLSRHFRRVLRQPGKAATMHTDGDAQLREHLAAHYSLAGYSVDADSIVLTAAGMQGFNLCVMAATQPGDTVLIEDPTFYPLLLTLHQRGLRAVTIESHPKFGVDPDEFDRLLKLHDIRAAVLMPRNHYPNGSCYSEDTAQRVVRSAAKRDVLIIENDAYGELFFGKRTAHSLKKFDEAGIVLHVGSLSSSLAPGYGIGWVIPGRTKTRIAGLRFFGAMLSGGLTQRAVAEYLSHESLDRHLRQLRRHMETRMQRGLQLLTESFHFDFEVIPPLGGFNCWVRGPDNLDAIALARRALDIGTSLLPGPLTSTARRFGNYFALNFSFPWTDSTVERLRRLGELVTAMI
jgi:DNA-binding transcriptional MocR family regulator